MSAHSVYMIDKKTVEDLLAGKEIPITENCSLKGDFTPEEIANFAVVPMVLWCPQCSKRHVDQGAFARKRHHTHACQSCGHVWRPAVVATVGVRFLPGFKDEENL